jgi:ubiquinone/menaquinone biosynthesis C-methylase UbiE
VDRAHGPLGPVLSQKARTSGSDPELEAGARAHFEDPAYYSDTYDWRDEDAVYYRDVAAKHGRVLEHGIGNGRVALPLARAGVHVTGIDHTAAMLDDLRARVKAEKPAVRKRIELHQGDVRTTRLKKRFPLVICPFNAALHLYTRVDVEQWLARVREHLEPGGELVFDISMPIPKDLARDPKTAYRVPPFDHPTAGRVKYREHFDYDRVRQILFVSMFFEPAPRKGKRPAKEQITESFMTPLAQRQYHPQEMETLLHYNGFDVKELYGDWERGPLVQASDIMVWHVAPRKKKP